VIQTREQANVQRFELQELALSIMLGAEQLTFREFIEEGRSAELFEIKADPKAHRTTRVFDPGAPVKYRCLETRSIPTIRFCWTVDRNAAGRFLIFRERVRRARIVRDQVEAILDKRAAIAACKLNRDEVDASREKARAKRALAGQAVQS
jgi:hypothetical protein